MSTFVHYSTSSLLALVFAIMPGSWIIKWLQQDYIRCFEVPYKMLHKSILFDMNIFYIARFRVVAMAWQIYDTCSLRNVD